MVSALPRLSSRTQRTDQKYPNDRLVLISISGDKDEKAWQEFVAKHEMSWSQVRDPDHKLGELFRVNGFPTYLVINGDGFIKARNRRTKSSGDNCHT